MPPKKNNKTKNQLESPSIIKKSPISKNSQLSKQQASNSPKKLVKVVRTERSSRAINRNQVQFKQKAAFKLGPDKIPDFMPKNHTDTVPQNKIYTESSKPQIKVGGSGNLSGYFPNFPNDKIPSNSASKHIDAEISFQKSGSQIQKNKSAFLRDNCYAYNPDRIRNVQSVDKPSKGLNLKQQISASVQNVILSPISKKSSEFSLSSLHEKQNFGKQSVQCFANSSTHRPQPVLNFAHAGQAQQQNHLNAVPIAVATVNQRHYLVTFLKEEIKFRQFQLWVVSGYGETGLHQHRARGDNSEANILQLFQNFRSFDRQGAPQALNQGQWPLMFRRGQFQETIQRIHHQFNDSNLQTPTRVLYQAIIGLRNQALIGQVIQDLQNSRITLNGEWFQSLNVQQQTTLRTILSLPVIAQQNQFPQVGGLQYNIQGPQPHAQIDIMATQGRYTPSSGEKRTILTEYNVEHGGYCRRSEYQASYQNPNPSAYQQALYPHPQPQQQFQHPQQQQQFYNQHQNQVGYQQAQQQQFYNQHQNQFGYQQPQQQPLQNQNQNQNQNQMGYQQPQQQPFWNQQPQQQLFQNQNQNHMGYQQPQWPQQQQPQQHQHYVPHLINYDSLALVENFGQPMAQAGADIIVGQMSEQCANLTNHLIFYHAFSVHVKNLQDMLAFLKESVLYVPNLYRHLMNNVDLRL